ncbi:hypothetical protein [Bradyrhizobium liaoningense]
MTTLPKDEQVRLILCEDIRPELNGKVSLLGFFPALSIRVKEVGETIAIPLAFLFLIESPPGKFAGTFSVERPDGKEMFNVAVQAVTNPGDDGTIINVKAVTFPVPMVGVYSALLALDGQKYVRKFNVQVDRNLI